MNKNLKKQKKIGDLDQPNCSDIKLIWTLLTCDETRHPSSFPNNLEVQSRTMDIATRYLFRGKNFGICWTTPQSMMDESIDKLEFKCHELKHDKSASSQRTQRENSQIMIKT